MKTKCDRMHLIKNLNLWGNDLDDISVVQSMPNLEVLSLSVNCVSSLTDLKHCPKLSELYLRKNEIWDLAEVLNLRHHQQMRVLWLSENPCTALPHYRRYVLHHLPGLTKLDSLDVTDGERHEAVQADLGSVQTRVVDVAHDDDPTADNYEDQYLSPADRSRSSAASTPGGNSEFRLADSPAIRNCQSIPGPCLQAWPAPASPATPCSGSPSWQQRRQGSGGGGQVGNGTGPMPRSNVFPGSGATGRNLAANGGHERSPPSQTSLAETAAGQAQPSLATDNILCAVLALIKELDSQGLELVRRAVDQNLEDARSPLNNSLR